MKNYHKRCEEYIKSFDLEGGGAYGVINGFYQIDYIAREAKLTVFFANVRLYFMWLFRKRRAKRMNLCNLIKKPFKQILSFFKTLGGMVEIRVKELDLALKEFESRNGESYKLHGVMQKLAAMTAERDKAVEDLRNYPGITPCHYCKNRGHQVSDKCRMNARLCFEWRGLERGDI